jgi:hypothetical protein
MTLAVAQATAGQFSAALESAAEARRLAAAGGEDELVAALDEMSRRFRRGERYHEAE